jgi:hypothetical protein
MTHCLRYESARWWLGSVPPHFSRAALTLNGRIVLVYKVALDQLDGQAGLSHTTTANYHQLVLSEKLRACQQALRHRRAATRTLDAIVSVCHGTAGAAAGLVAVRGSCDGATATMQAPGTIEEAGGRRGPRYCWDDQGRRVGERATGTRRNDMGVRRDAVDAAAVVQCSAGEDFHWQGAVEMLETETETGAGQCSAAEQKRR